MRGDGAWPGATPLCGTMGRSRGRAEVPRGTPTRPAEPGYLQPGSLTVCPGGWHLAAGSCGPFWLFPGPKSGLANTGAAEIDRAATDRIPDSGKYLLTLHRSPPSGQIRSDVGVLGISQAVQLRLPAVLWRPRPAGFLAGRRRSQAGPAARPPGSSPG